MLSKKETRITGDGLTDGHSNLQALHPVYFSYFALRLWEFQQFDSC